MMSRPFVSVVIPTYNRAQQVKAAVESVIGQTYSDFEVLVIDDGSTDLTREAIQQLACEPANGGKEIRYIRQTNSGQSAARNRGIQESRGDWIAFLDSDDVWLPDKLEQQVRAIDYFGGRCGACTADARLLSSSGAGTTAFQVEGKHYEEEFGIDAEAVNNLAKSFGNYWVSVLLGRADLMKRIGGFDAEIRFAEDRDFHFRLSLVTAFCYVNRPLALIDRSDSPPGSASRPWDSLDVRLSAQLVMYEKWLQLEPGLAPGTRRVVEADLRALHSAWANWHLENKRYREARHAVSQAAKYDLTAGVAVKWILTHVAPGVTRQITPKGKPYL